MHILALDENGVNSHNDLILRIITFMANLKEANAIKYTNFPTKFMNTRSKIHRKIHRVFVRSVTHETIARVLLFPELHDHVERHSAFNTSSQ